MIMTGMGIGPATSSILDRQVDQVGTLIRYLVAGKQGAIAFDHCPTLVAILDALAMLGPVLPVAAADVGLRSSTRLGRSGRSALLSCRQATA